MKNKSKSTFHADNPDAVSWNTRNTRTNRQIILCMNNQNCLFLLELSCSRLRLYMENIGSLLHWYVFIDIVSLDILNYHYHIITTLWTIEREKFYLDQALAHECLVYFLDLLSPGRKGPMQHCQYVTRSVVQNVSRSVISFSQKLAHMIFLIIYVNFNGFKGKKLKEANILE